MGITYASSTVTVAGGKEAGTCPSSGSHTTTNIVVPSGAGGSNAFAGRFVWIHTGANAGQRRYITGSSANSLTVTPALPAACDNTSQFMVSYNLADIQAASTAGGWGVVSTSGSVTNITADLVTGDGTRTYLGDVEKVLNIVWPSVTLGTYANYFLIKNNAAQQFGYLDANGNEVAGCQIVLSAINVNTSATGVFLIGASSGSAATTGSLYWYDTRYTFFRNTADAVTVAGFMRLYSPVELKRVNFSKHGGGRIYDTSSVIAKAVFHEGYAQAWGAAATLSTPLADLEFYNEDYAVKNVDAYAVELRRPVFRNNNYIILVGGLSGPTYTGTVSLFDSNVNMTTGNIYVAVGATTVTGYVDEYKSYNSKVVNSGGSAVSGVRVRIANNPGTELFNALTDGAGTITQQDLKFSRWTGPGSTAGNAAGLFTQTTYGPFSFRFRKYGYTFLASTKSVGDAPISDGVTLSSNPFVVASQATAAAYTGTAINGSAKTITLTSAHTLQEVYDYSQAWGELSGNIGYDECLTTADGSNFALATPWTLTPGSNLTFSGKRLSGGVISYSTPGTYSPVLGAIGIQFTAVGTYILSGIDATGTLTLTNTSGGAVTVQLPSGLSLVNTGPSITVSTPLLYQSVTVTGLVAGSRVQLYDTTSSTEIYNAVVAGTSFTWTDSAAASASRAVRLRVARQSGTSAYLFLEANIGTCGTSSGNAAISYLASQTADAVYNANAVDGSAVTGITIVDAVDRMQINIAGGTVSWAQIYAYNVYWLFTATGIQDDGSIITAKDQANYAVTLFKIKNTSSTPLKITGGYGVDSTTGSVADILDTTGGSIFPVVDHVVSNVVTVGGVNVITGDISTVLAAIPSATANASAVLSAASATPIYADTRKMNGAAVLGNGTSGNKWRG